MSEIESSSDAVPLPALLVERAVALARAEVGLALVHARRLSVRAVGALLGTVVACAFAQLALVLLVAWPAASAYVSTGRLLAGVLASVALSLTGAVSAIVAWAGVHDRKPKPATLRAQPELAAAAQPAKPARDRGLDANVQAPAATLAERVSL